MGNCGELGCMPLPANAESSRGDGICGMPCEGKTPCGGNCDELGCMPMPATGESSQGLGDGICGMPPMGICSDLECMPHLPAIGEISIPRAAGPCSEEAPQKGGGDDIPEKAAGQLSKCGMFGDP